MIEHSLLHEPTFSVIARGTARRSLLTLPQVFAALTRDDVDDFAALRPHQRHVWHAFLVQIAAIFLHQSGTSALPASPDEWTAALLSLTPLDTDGAAWALVTPVNRPAFFQPAVPEGSLDGFRAVVTPDDLDMLVTAKNHDVKMSIMRIASAEDWALALLSLQTQEGFLGAGNYGISRMNGGFASRSGLGVVPSGGLGRRFIRDVWRLLELRSSLLEEYDMYPESGGTALLWTTPWDGTSSISPRSLDIFYIEICRRVRLWSNTTGELSASVTGSKVARVDAKALKGRSGDGWTPLIADGADRKGLTIDPGSFGYKRITGLIFPRVSDADSAIRAPLQVISSSDDQSGLHLIAQGVVRGEGKTQGFHERRIPVSAYLRRFLVERPADIGAAIASDRVEDASAFARKVLYPAALCVFTAAPLQNERKRDDDTAKNRAGRVVDHFDALVDRTFFEALSEEIAVCDDQPAATATRAQWLVRLMNQARELLDECALAAPSAAMRAYRTRARSRDLLEFSFLRHFGDRTRISATEPPRAQPGTS